MTDVAKWLVGSEPSSLVQTASGPDIPSSGLTAVLGDVRTAVPAQQGSLVENTATAQWMCAINKVAPRDVREPATFKALLDRGVSDSDWPYILQVASPAKPEPLVEQVSAILREYGGIIALGTNNNRIYVDVGTDGLNRKDVMQSASSAEEDIKGPRPKWDQESYDSTMANYKFDENIGRDVTAVSASAGRMLDDLKLLSTEIPYATNFSKRGSQYTTTVISEHPPEERPTLSALDSLIWSTVHELAHANLYEIEQTKQMPIAFSLPSEHTKKLIAATHSNPEMSEYGSEAQAVRIVFVESYADSLAALSVATSRGADEGLKFVTGMYEARLLSGELTKYSVAPDSHDTSAALTSLTNQFKHRPESVERLADPDTGVIGEPQSMRLHHQAIELAADSVSSWAAKAGVNAADASAIGNWFKAEYAEREQLLLAKSDLMTQPHPEYQVKPMNQDTVSELKGAIAQAVCEAKRDALVAPEREMTRQPAGSSRP